MKYIFNKILLLCAGLVVVACNTDIEPASQNPATRTIKVRTAATRTTIQYEGSDVSHLVWQDGDMVAYCTDSENDTFRTATVTSNEFDAEIPENAGKIVVIYPVSGNEGKTLVQASAALAQEIQCNIDTTFDGSLLPMMAMAAVPQSDVVDVEYDCLASVIRFRILPADSTEESVESLQEVTLSANEDFIGTFGMGADGNIAFSGTDNSVTIRVSGTAENLLLTENPEVYAVVNRMALTGVNVTVKTDLQTYTFKDGTMDVSHPERSLYRVNLDLSTVETGAPPVPEPYFVTVTDINDITDDGTYLIATYKDEGSYYITDNKPTDASNYYYLNGVTAACDETGIPCTDDILTYTWQIKKEEGGYTIFSPYLVKNGNTGLYMIAMGGTGAFSSGNHDKTEVKAWFVTGPDIDKYAEAEQPRRYWDISIDTDGTATLRNMYDRGAGINTYYKFCIDHNYFTLCTEGMPYESEIRLLKLTEVSK